MVRRLGVWFWLGWSRRDLRNHWVAVVAIGVVIAIGTGVYAGLSSTSTWRRLSNDASFAAGNMHALRATMAPGTFADQGELVGLVRELPSADRVDAVTERLLIDTQMEVETDDGTVLVSGNLIGGGLDTGVGGGVDRVWLRDGVPPASGEVQAVLRPSSPTSTGWPSRGR